MLLVQRTASMYQLQAADLVIKPRVGHIRWDEMGRAEELMTAGYEAAVELLPEIQTRIEAALRSAPKWYSLRRRKEAFHLPARQRPRIT
ncbi:MAG: hypothetical protein ABJB97_09545, partial [Acidobacteriota bacterium]